MLNSTPSKQDGLAHCRKTSTTPARTSRILPHTLRRLPRSSRNSSHSSRKRKHPTGPPTSSA
jgi:hypothetical protein